MNTLEQQAIWMMEWRFRCEIVIANRELHPLWRPDIFGVTKDRKTYEIEIKRSLGDFRANADKTWVANRELYIKQWPWKFYFMVPYDLVRSVKPILPDYAGLIYATDCGNPHVVRRAPQNKVNARASAKQIYKAVIKVLRDAKAMRAMGEAMCHDYII